MPARKKASNHQLLESYAILKNVWRVAEQFGMCGQSVHERLTKLNAIDSGKWTKEDDAALTQLYTNYKEPLFLESVAKSMGRTKAAVACRANELGLTSRTRKRAQDREKMSKTTAAWIKEHGHPKGMAGKKHSAKTIEALSDASKKMWERFTPEQLDSRFQKQIATRIKNGTVNPFKNISNPHSRSCSGKRSDLGNCFFRSKAEANYARYLNLLGQEWEYEPKEFIFETIRKGCVSYTPDFYNKTTDQWVEVKGWLEPKAKTKLKRFKKYFPSEYKKLIVITQSRKTMLEISGLGMPYIRYEDIAQKVSKLIPFWE